VPEHRRKPPDEAREQRGRADRPVLRLAERLLPRGDARFPSPAALRIARASRKVRVHTYDIAAAGVQPPLSWASPVSTPCETRHDNGIFSLPLDLCNEGLGKLYERTFAAPYQGVYWGNHDLGGSLATTMQARLQASYRAVASPEQAHLHFIPLESKLTCQTNSGWGNDTRRAFLQTCGFDFRDAQTRTIPDMWKWLLKQPSFQRSNGSDHFIIIEPSGWHEDNEPWVRARSGVVLRSAFPPPRSWDAPSVGRRAGVGVMQPA
jgi:hypothetical protein